jgi:hypothetical protein
MPNLLVAGNSTNGGTAISTDTSGTLNIVTGSGSGANAITIDASQNVAMTASQTIAGNLTVTGTITGTGGVSGGLGTGQTWQVVTRTAGTTYTNSTGKPIVWEIIWGANSTLTFTVQSITREGLASPAGNQQMATFIVPPSATYSFTGTSGFISNRELR